MAVNTSGKVVNAGAVVDTGLSGTSAVSNLTEGNIGSFFVDAISISIVVPGVGTVKSGYEIITYKSDSIGTFDRQRIATKGFSMRNDVRELKTVFTEHWTKDNIRKWSNMSGKAWVDPGSFPKVGR